jgi:hypothetical protein
MGERGEPHSYRQSPQPWERTTPSSSWETTKLMEMAVKTIEMAVESMEMAPGAHPRPGKVPEQRLLSPKIGLRRWRRCGTLLGETSTDLGFSRWRLFIGGGAMSEGGQGPHTIGWRAQGGTRATRWCGCPWPPSDSSLDSVSCRGKIGPSGFVSSNSKNISCVTFLKHKNSRKQGTSTVVSRQ